MKLRDEAQELASKFANRLRNILSGNKQVSEEQAEAASRRFEKAVFHSIYSEGEFETALDKHREMMRVLGEAIGDKMTEFRREWQRYKQKGEHEGYAHRSLAKSHFKRIISLEERIDAHLRQFERKLQLLSAWRQHKVENDIGADVDVEEVEQFVGEEFDQFQMQETSPEVQEGHRIIDGEKGSAQAAVSEQEEEVLNQFVEDEFGDEMDFDDDIEDTDTDLSGGLQGNGHEETKDDEVRDFLEDELEQ